MTTFYSFHALELEDYYPSKVSEVLPARHILVDDLDLHDVRERGADGLHVDGLVVHGVVIVELDVVDARGPVNVGQLEGDPMKTNLSQKEHTRSWVLVVYIIITRGSMGALW